MKILSTTPHLYNSKNQMQKSYNQQQVNTNFTGTKSLEHGLMNRLETKIARWCVKLIDTKPFEFFVKKTNEYKNIADKLMAHLIVLGSTALSGFYVVKTLKNKQMDEDKRKTLAINQGLVWGVSTVMAYSFDNWARKKFDEKILKKFEKANAGMDKNKFNGLKSGMGIARTIIIVDMVYRFIAPVIVTPFANAIGNRMYNNKECKK